MPPRTDPTPTLRPLLRLFDLRRDQESAENIDLQIREGVDAVGTNLWVLVMAIFIASIGLNVNSTAVIIGAMLISPLMGPIVGIGYAAGVHDFALLRRASRSLGVMTLFSLITATLYFSVTPLNEAQSELLARTSPTLWDVLIAFFGGAAGIVAITRKEISNVVPGVAIATALMPPLCTTGYGIANGNWAFAAGAFYLFLINGVFIALATLAFVKVARLPQKEELEPHLATRHRWILGVLVGLLIVPSAVLAWRLVQVEHFEAAARDVLRDYREDARFYLLGADIDGTARSLRLAITGDTNPEDLEAELVNRFRAAGIERVAVAVRRTGAASTDLKPIEEFLARRESSMAQRELDETRSRAVALETENAALRARESVKEALLSEVAAQFPEASRVIVASGVEVLRESEDPVDGSLLLVHLSLPEAIDPEAADRLLMGWRARFPGYVVRLDTRVVVPEPDPESEGADGESEVESNEAAAPAAAETKPATTGAPAQPAAT